MCFNALNGIGPKDRRGVNSRLETGVCGLLLLMMIIMVVVVVVVVMMMTVHSLHNHAPRLEERSVPVCKPCSRRCSHFFLLLLLPLLSPSFCALHTKEEEIGVWRNSHTSNWDYAKSWFNLALRRYIYICNSWRRIFTVRLVWFIVTSSTDSICYLVDCEVKIPPTGVDC